MSNAWDRQPTEPMKWYLRFERYLLMGPDRTLVGAYNSIREKETGIKRKYANGAWNTIARRWKWSERAEAWDAHNVEDDRSEWQKRRDAWREKEWKVASALLEKAENMLGTEVSDLEWRASDMPKLAEVASKIARLASGMDTERAESMVWDPADFTNEELKEIEENGGDVRAVLAKRKYGASGEDKAGAGTPA